MITEKLAGVPTSWRVAVVADGCKTGTGAWQRAIVDGIREMFRGDFTPWPGLGGVGLTVALAIIGVAVGTRVFQRESA